MNRELTEALSHLIETKSEHDIARKECDDGWEYVGSGYIERLEEAEKGFTVELEKLIDRRIKQTKGLK